MSELARIHCWIVRETEKALLVSKIPPNRTSPDQGPDAIWIPRSMCEGMTKLPPLPNGWREANIRMTESFAEMKGLL